MGGNGRALAIYHRYSVDRWSDATAWHLLGSVVVKKVRAVKEA
jgi:hypothetical protein